MTNWNAKPGNIERANELDKAPSEKDQIFNGLWDSNPPLANLKKYVWLLFRKLYAQKMQTRHAGLR